MYSALCIVLFIVCRESPSSDPGNLLLNNNELILIGSKCEDVYGNHRNRLNTCVAYKKGIIRNSCFLQ